MSPEASISYKPRIEVTSNTGLQQYRDLDDMLRFGIGSHPSNEICVKDKIVADFHAEIMYDGSRLFFSYLDPTSRQPPASNIYYMGQENPKDGPWGAYNGGWRKELIHGDVFRIGDEDGSFVTLTYSDGTRVLKEVLPTIHNLPSAGAGDISIGRRSEKDIFLNDGQVSPDHASIKQKKPNICYIVDKKSRNGTFVNGRRISSRRKLKVNDAIGIGPFTLLYRGTYLEEYHQNTVRIEAQHLTKKARHLFLLDDISLVIQPQRLVAIVGSSGVGKSMLLNALSGLRPARKGRVLYNGENYYHSMLAFNARMGYVPQEDSIHRAITVEHALYYAAQLRLPAHSSKNQLQERVHNVLCDVGLLSHSKKLISQLSGGQRKRVVIAMELLAQPNIFFLDEPTSGLDSGMDRKMMWLLRRLADGGRTVVFVTHTINNIDACDYVCILAAGGRLAYFGPPAQARLYFKKHFDKDSFTEIYSALEPTEKDEYVAEKAKQTFLASHDYKQYIDGLLLKAGDNRSNRSRGRRKSAAFPKPGKSFKHFLVLCVRYIELLRHDIGTLLVFFLQAPVVGLLLWFLVGSSTFDPTSVASCPTASDPLSQSGAIVSYDCQRLVAALATPDGHAYVIHLHESPQMLVQAAIQYGSGADAQAVLLFMGFAAALLGCINGCREIVKEQSVYQRERDIGLRIMPYLCSKITVLGVLCLLQSFLLVGLVQWRSPFQQGIILPPFLEIYITMALTSLSGLMIGLFISALVPNSDRSLAILPWALLPQILFSGAIFSLGQSLSLQIIGAFFPVRWAMIAMGSSVGLHADKLRVDTFSYWGTLFSTYNQRLAIEHLFLAWGALIAQCILLALLTIWRLKLKDTHK